MYIIIGSIILIFVLVYVYGIISNKKEQRQNLNSASIDIVNKDGKNMMIFTCGRFNFEEEIPDLKEIELISNREATNREKLTAALIQDPSLNDGDLFRVLGGCEDHASFVTLSDLIEDVRNEVLAWHLQQDIINDVAEEAQSQNNIAEAVQNLNNLAYNGNLYALVSISELNLNNHHPEQALAGCLQALYHGTDGVKGAAFNLLGLIINHRDLVGIPPEKIIEVFKCGVKYGNPAAYRNLGTWYFNGYFTEQNKEVGKALLERAAKLGLPNNELEEKVD